MEGREDLGFRLEDYHYDLPAGLIAQTPSPARDASRLLVLDRSQAGIGHFRFGDILGFLKPGDVLVTNDTRVVPARLTGVKESGGRVELLVLDPYKAKEAADTEGYCCLVKASKRVRPGGIIALDGGVQATFLKALGGGKAQVRFLTVEPLLSLLERIGNIPLPPYIHREGDESPIDDLGAYQTVYARKPGAVAAPTAGLHFSEPLLDALRQKGVERVNVTLHVGYGTFAPIREEDIRRHAMHSEHVEISGESADRIAAARKAGRRIVAVGTTVVRTLEWIFLKAGKIDAFSGPCDHYIYPGYRFQAVDAMITNFHLPKSTLLLLVSAFAGRERILNAYREAISDGYRFFSYGDAMLIL